MDISDQITRIKNAWDPNSPECAFTHYFYNRVPADQAPYYQMPPGSNQQKWDKALAQKPDAQSIPVLATGFNDLEKRRAQQIQQVNSYRVRMNEINEKLKSLSTRHELHSSVKLTELNARHRAITGRILKLAIRLQLEASRGRSLTPEEELYTQQLRQLAQSSQDPSKFGSLTENLARVQSLPKVPADETQKHLNWEQDGTQLQQVAAILKDQQKGITFLVSLLEEDLSLVNRSLGSSPSSI